MAKRVLSCGLDPSLSMIGGKWKFLILWHLALSPLSIRGSSTPGRRHQCEDVDSGTQGDHHDSKRSPIAVYSCSRNTCP